MSGLLNYTPHELLVYRPDDADPIELPRRGIVRCAERQEPGGTFPGTDIARTIVSYGEVSGLPEPEPGVVIVVSQLVVGACPERTDLAFPTGLTRNARGDITGFRELGCLPRATAHDEGK